MRTYTNTTGHESHAFAGGWLAQISSHSVDGDVLRTLNDHRADLDRTLELAGPTMRVFTNATGDGPWLGVNAPWAIFPDDLVCTLTTEDCS